MARQSEFWIFMEKCSTAYYARASASVWTSFDGGELHGLPQQLSLHGVQVLLAGRLIEADSRVERLCEQVSLRRGVDTSGMNGRAVRGENRYSGAFSVTSSRRRH